MDPQPNFYTNPAFCQQSEFVPQNRALSPQRNIRQSPVGAQTSHQVFDNSLSDLQGNPDHIEEQEFYEEVIVDDQGFIKGKKVVVVAQNNEGQKYIQGTQHERQGSRYGSTQYHPPKSQKSRYEYIPMREQQDMRSVPRSTPKKSLIQEHVEVAPGVVHRYAVIEPEEETPLTNINERYALVPMSQFNNVIPQQKTNRYDYIASSDQAEVNRRYEYIQTSPVRSGTRYEYPQEQSTPQKMKSGGRYDYAQQHNSPARPGTNPVATQMLHELLSTPKKVKVLSPLQSRRMSPSPLSPITRDPFQTPPRPTKPPPNSKVQQKLNYAFGGKQLVIQEKRLQNTAVVPPMCSSPVQSIYAETTYSQKSESGTNISSKSSAFGQTLIAAAFIMFLCGLGTTSLSFYMLSFMGRPYYLDFSIVSGFTCTVMGILGCRSKNVYWVPNRNYLSGYLALTVFSLLTCAGLVVLLVNDPLPGTPLADMTSAAVCGFSVLTLLLTLTGVVSSYCCMYPPPDNRVQIV
ncbi:uncharacterized protein spdo [Euwallacea similis]|uniref:uncharacterized protein spdo n=1 Tax=Euwallacea similis TaxID=1736056 RepID=UPI00345104A1